VRRSRHAGRRKPEHRSAAARLAVGAGLVLAVAMSDPAAGGGLRDLTDGWLLSPSELVAQLWPAPDGHRPPVRRFWLGQARLYGMADLPVLACGLQLPLLGLRWSGQWQRLGATLFQEHQWRLGCGWSARLAPRVSVGWDRLALAGTDPRGQLYLSAGVTLRLAAGWRLCCQPPLTPAPPWYGPTAARRWLLLTGGGGGVAAACAVERTGAGVPLVQLELVGRIATRVGLGLRAEPVTGTVGLTTAWRHASWLLRTAHLVHPQLGVTHRWYLTVAGSGAHR
jgi:hypothetical protein